MVQDNASPRTDRLARPERRAISTRRVIDEAKARVSTLDLAQRLCGELRRVGARHVARCPLPGHDDCSPSFTVYEATDSFNCFGCLRGGDVVELARFAWGYSNGEVKMAAADLLRTFGHDIPERPKSWRARQERQEPVRDAIDRARFEHLRRRLFRTFFKASVMAIEDGDEREAEYAILWDATEPLARMMLDDLYERRRPT